MMSEVRLVDYSFDHPAPAAIRASDATGAMRYLTRQPPPKRVTLDEVSALHAAGLGVGFVFEDGKGRALEGQQAGHDDAVEAYRQAHELGVPAGVAIFFAVDQQTTVDAVAAYFHGVQSVPTVYEVGVYGSATVVDGILSRQSARYGWQTAAWSAEVVSKVAHLYQRNANLVAPVPGTDENVLLRPFPLWNSPSGGPMPLIYPGATWRPIDSHGGPMVHDMGLVEHITTNDFDPYGFFSNPANKASSHLWISLTGLVEQYISLDLASWAQAGGNGGWVSVEIAGVEGTPKTAAQVEALAKLLAWGSAEPALRWPLRLTDSPDVAGFGWHGMGGDAWGGHQFCPGAVRRAQRPAVLARAKQLASGAPPTPAPPAAKDTTMLVRYLASDGKTQIKTDGIFKSKISNPEEVADLIEAGLLSDAPPVPLTTGSHGDRLLRKLPWAPAP